MIALFTVALTGWLQAECWNKMNVGT